jgi:hypothetical protein
VDRLEDALARDRRLLLARRRERVAQVLRDVLQRPDVEVRGRVLDRLLQVGRRPCSCLAFSAAPARAAAEDDALEQRVAHHAVAPVRAAGDLAARVDALERRLGVVSITRPPFW